MKKFSFPWANFFANFFAVILGILVTFGINNCVESDKKNKEIKEIMSLVKTELDSDISLLHNFNDGLKSECGIYKSICAANFDANKYSASELCNINKQMLMVYFIEGRPFAENALISSGVLSDIKDKKLAIDISNAFLYSTFVQRIFRTQAQRKQELLAPIAPALYDAKTSVDTLNLMLKNNAICEQIKHYNDIEQITLSIDEYVEKIENVVDKLEKLGY